MLKKHIENILNLISLRSLTLTIINRMPPFGRGAFQRGVTISLA